MYNDTHRYILQYLMTTGVATYDKVRNLYKKLDNDMESSSRQFDKFISEINEAINPNEQEIRKATCEVSGLQMLVFLNTISNDLTRIQSSWKKRDFDFIKLMIDHIMETENRQCLKTDLCNLPYKLKGAAYAKERAAEVIEDLIWRGYLAEIEDGNVIFGLRFIHEMDLYLKDTFTEGELHDCDICKQMVFTGSTCTHCKQLFHRHCFAKYIERINKCPSCQTNFNDGDNENNTRTKRLKSLRH